MALQNISAFGKLKKYTDAKPGEILVQLGKFLGVTQGQFGPIYEFQDGPEKISLPNCGSLEFLHKKEKLKIGNKYQVKFLGKKEITDGKFKGKSFNELEILEDVPDDSPVHSGQSDLDDILA